MKAVKRKKLESAGWKVGSVDEFLGLTPEEAAYIEIKLLLSKKLRMTRERRKYSQEQLAQLIHSSQSRVAKMEAGDPSVSVDLLLRALIATGMTPKQIGDLLARP